MAERVIKACLLLPADEKLLQKLRPLAALAEESFAQPMASDRLTLAWRAFSLALMKYREGDFKSAEAMSQKSLAFDSRNDVTIASVRLSLAMSHFQLGQEELARNELAEARDTIENHQLATDNGVDVVWFDWVFARILLREATGLIGPSR
jgi:tetratricopeptide (TPR) repeat protein